MKSYVSLEQKICIVTGKTYDTDAILLDKRIQNSLDTHTTTGYGISPEVQAKIDEGYIILIGVDKSKSTIHKSTKIDTIKPENAFRTGELMYIKKKVAQKIFNIKLKVINYISSETIVVIKKTLKLK